MYVSTLIENMTPFHKNLLLLTDLDEKYIFFYDPNKKLDIFK